VLPDTPHVPTPSVGTGEDRRASQVPPCAMIGLWQIPYCDHHTLQPHIGRRARGQKQPKWPISTMTNLDLVLAQIRAVPGLTDAELVRRTGIGPHQQVNAITNKLQARSLVRRVAGAGGALVNVAVDVPRVVGYTAPAHQPQEQPRVLRSSTPTGTIGSLDLATTLVVIPCSKRKAEGGTIARGASLCSAVEGPEGRALRVARRRVRERAHVDEHRLMPAYQRYTGAF
jgi:MarR family